MHTVNSDRGDEEMSYAAVDTMSGLLLIQRMKSSLTHLQLAFPQAQSPSPNSSQLGGWALTWGEPPGEKPWLETGEVGDWVAGEPVWLRYCWREEG